MGMVSTTIVFTMGSAMGMGSKMGIWNTMGMGYILVKSKTIFTGNEERKT